MIFLQIYNTKKDHKKQHLKYCVEVCDGRISDLIVLNTVLIWGARLILNPRRLVRFIVHSMSTPLLL